MTFETLLIQNWRPFRVSQYTRGWCVTTETGILFSLSMLTSREPYLIFLLTLLCLSERVSFFLTSFSSLALLSTEQKRKRKKLTIKYIRSNTTWETIILQTPLPSPPPFFPPPPPLLFPLFFHIFINPLRLKWQKNHVNPNHDQKSLDGKKHLYLKFMILRKFFILSLLSSNVMLKLLQLWYLNGAVGGIVVEPLMTRQ